MHKYQQVIKVTAKKVMCQLRHKRPVNVEPLTLSAGSFLFSHYSRYVTIPIKLSSDATHVLRTILDHLL